MGIGKAPWERDDEYYNATPKTVAPDMQLPSGVPLEAPQPRVRRPEPVAEEVWTEDDAYEEAPRRRVMEARPYEEETIRYEEEEADNWREATGKDRYEAPAANYEAYDDDLEKDAWEDDEAPQPIVIPKKVKEIQPEYEEEGGY